MKGYYTARDLNKWPKGHKILMVIQLIYLFLLPTFSIFYLEWNAWGNVIFRFSGWLMLVLYMTFYINNYSLPDNFYRAFFQVLLVPSEVIIFYCLFDIYWVNALLDLFFIEIVGFSLGLFLAGVLKVADEPFKSRLFVYLLTLISIFIFGLEYWNYWQFNFANDLWMKLLALLLPLGQLGYQYFQRIISIKKEEEGTTDLMKRLTPVIGIFTLIWVLMPFVIKLIIEINNS